MVNLQVLVATMNQEDLSLYKKMNLQCDTIFANQCGKNCARKETIDGHNVLMVSTDTVGVGINRNVALMYATADIVLFADDDVVYQDGYDQEVIRAFQKYPDADAILFRTVSTKTGEADSLVGNGSGRLKFYNSFKYATYSIACKSETIKKYNMHFSELFGGGCIYGCGEDSLFIADLYRNKCRVYSSDYILLHTLKDDSTWFQGFNEKYFFDKGAWIKCAFPKMYWLMKWYFVLRFARLSDLTAKERLRQLNLGIRGFDNLQVYQK